MSLCYVGISKFVMRHHIPHRFWTYLNACKDLLNLQSIHIAAARKSASCMNRISIYVLSVMMIVLPTIVDYLIFVVIQIAVSIFFENFICYE